MLSSPFHHVLYQTDKSDGKYEGKIMFEQLILIVTKLNFRYLCKKARHEINLAFRLGVEVSKDVHQATE